MSVLLPAPFSPHRATTSPGPAEIETSLSARTPPKLFEMCRISSRGGRAAPMSAWFRSGAMGGLIQDRHRVVNLAGDFDKADRWIQMPPDHVLFEGLDL